MALFSIIIKFFERLKKQLKKSEVLINFGEKELGHLVPLTVGHRDKPTEDETRHIRNVMRKSNFLMDPRPLSQRIKHPSSARE
jgi:hypothetical protein